MRADMMKTITAIVIIISTLSAFACNISTVQYPILMGSQHMSCDRLFNSSGEIVSTLATPKGFSISPYEAIKLASEKSNFKCGHKLGAQIYADSRYYYLVRLGGGRTLDLQKALPLVSVFVDGNSGAVWEIKYTK